MLHVSLEAAWCMGKALAESLPNIYISPLNKLLNLSGFISYKTEGSSVHLIVMLGESDEITYLFRWKLRKRLSFLFGFL